MRRLLLAHDIILMEAAVVERLRRDVDVDLHPQLVHAGLVYDDVGREALRRIYQSYIAIAHGAGLPLLVCTPTWRANRERVDASGVSQRINTDAVHFMNELRQADNSHGAAVKIGGLIGCKNDCYRPEESLGPDESETFHSWQIGELASAGVDFLIAETLPATPEAVGIARCMAATGVPYVISFVINREGCVLDGTPLWEAMCIIDESVADRPLGFMVNCAHPSFLCAARQAPEVFTRLIGYQANSSSLDHADLDGASRCHVDDVTEWAKQMLALNRTYGVKILGGCCGTGDDHLRHLAGRR